MVIVDRLTKRARFIPTTDNLSTKELATILYSRIFPIHGLPKQIVSDRGTQFASELFREWCETLNVQRSMTTAYHPQADGQTERVNQTLEQYLRCYIEVVQKDNWSQFLPTAEFAYNNAASETTKNSPFYVELGRHPNAGPTDLRPTTNADLNQIAQARWAAQDQAKAAMKIAAERWSWYYDQGRKAAPFDVGDKVLVDVRKWQDTERSLSPRYIGPFKIIEKLSPVTFKLHMDSQYRAYHPVFHASKLVLYKEATIQNKPPPQPERNEEGEETWEVENILDHRRRGSKMEYRIRWKGFTVSDDSWIPEMELNSAAELLEEYKLSQPDLLV
ncbi:ribonuclease H-like protein [Wolfiporia cocos MD-104 SS10]|uniref:Ribonuclease H-like protein n=1 Tax=Wolfiporia cocos (strain MD-104) TaxID=742152 RepID=A0A2H3J392_WOLCO|nr:ribonuclease H-like protein [Wolfiporia cocos MD-104 SS10]